MSTKIPGMVHLGHILPHSLLLKPISSRNHARLIQIETNFSFDKGISVVVMTVSVINNEYIPRGSNKRNLMYSSSVCTRALEKMTYF